MQPEQPVNSEVVAPADAVSAEPRSPEETESSAQPSAWHRLFGALTGRGTPETTEPTADAGTSQKPPSTTLTLTQDELDRRVQAETDRREAKRQRERSEQDERDRREALERKLDPASPDYDPYAGTEERARIKAAEDAGEQFTGLLQTVSQQHDAATLDQIVGALPERERERIFKLDGAGVGLDGRKLIVAEGLKALEKHWKAEGAREAKAQLQGDPIFRKKVFNEHRGDVEEPELVVGTAARNGNDFMDTVFKDYRAAKGRRS